MNEHSLDTVPEVLYPGDAAPSRREREREKSAVREAIVNCLDARSGQLEAWIDRIEEVDGPKAAFDSFIKLLEFALPKLQRVTVQDPDGNAPAMPVINVHFNPHA